MPLKKEYYSELIQSARRGGHGRPPAWQRGRGPVQGSGGQAVHLTDIRRKERRGCFYERIEQHVVHHSMLSPSPGSDFCRINGAASIHTHTVWPTLTVLACAVRRIVLRLCFSTRAPSYCSSEIVGTSSIRQKYTHESTQTPALLHCHLTWLWLAWASPPACCRTLAWTVGATTRPQCLYRQTYVAPRLPVSSSPWPNCESSRGRIFPVCQRHGGTFPQL